MIKIKPISFTEFVKPTFILSILIVSVLFSFTKAVAQPTLSAPTATATTNTTATLGGTVDTGTGITERGTVWNVGSAPSIGDNLLAEGGTTTGTFTHSRIALPPKSQIFYAPYAIDGGGTTVGPDDNFYTLANEPGAIATFTSGTQTSTSIDLTWDASTGATGYLVYMSTGGSAPTPTLTDGTSPTGSPVNQSGTSFTETGLTRYTEYSFTVIPYDWDGGEETTYNFGTPITLTSVFTLETAPVVTSPTETAITNNSATLGGNITDVGGNVLTERGTLWETSSPISISDNQLDEGGTGGGVFTDARSSLPAKTQIFYAPYAINAVATTIGPEGSFYTLANEPGAIATFTSPAQAATTIDLSWGASTNAFGYLIYMNTGSTAPSPSLTDGAAPTGSPVANITGGTTTTISPLLAVTEYSFTIVPYDWDGSEPTTYNYGNSNTLTSVFTLCNYPTTQPTGLSFSTVHGDHFDLSWTGGNGDRTLVVIKEGGAVDAVPVDGVTYTADTDFESGSEIGTGNYVVSTDDNGSDVTINNLNSSSTYFVAVFSYNNSTKCYNITSPPTNSTTTPGPLPTSTITGGTGAASISSIQNSFLGAPIVFTFTLTDDAGDGNDTEFTQLIINRETGSDDTGGWAGVLASARLSHDGSGGDTYTATPTDNSIVFTGISNSNDQLGNIPEGTPKVVSLIVYLETNLGGLQSTIDGLNLAFEISGGDFSIIAGHSSFNPSSTTNSNADLGDNNPIEVLATEIAYTTQPSATAIANIALAQQPILEATDGNGNIDLDFSEILAVTTPDATLNPASALASFTNGYADFTASGFNLQSTGSSRIRVTTSPSGLVANSSPNTVVSASTTVTEITGGIATSPLSSGSTNNALFGFNLTTTGSTLNFTGGTITTSSDPDGKILNLSLYRSTDGDYSTAGDNTLIAGAAITTPTASTISISGISESIDGTTANNFFIIAEVEGNVFAATPTLQLSIANTSDLSVSTGAVIGTPFVGDLFSFADVTPPTILSTTASVNPIYDGNLVQTIQIIYSESMQTGVNPSISFINSADFTPGTGSWSTTNTTNDTWTQAFTHGVIAEEFTESVTVAVGILDLAGNADAVGGTSNTFVLDTRNPTAAVAISTNPITLGSLTQTVTVTYDEAMDPAGAKEPTISFGTSADFTTNNDGAWSVGNTVWTESFTHGVVQEQIAAEIAIVPTASGATDVAGNTDIGGSSPPFVIDTKQPEITSITTATLSGIYTSPTIINIEVNLDEAVTVTGTPQITLNTTPSAAVVNYNAGLSIATQLVFSYTIGANENADPLDVVSMNLNGGSILDAVSNGANLTIPLAPNRLQDDKTIEVDTQQPSITAVTSLTATGYYNDANVISIQITFDEIVAFTGSPVLILNSGGTATYTPSVAGLTHTFTYTVGATDNANPLDYAATTSLVLNGGTIRDVVNLNAILTLPAINGGNSIQNDKTIIIDTDEPTALTLTPADDSFNYRVDGNFVIQFAEDIQTPTTGFIRIFDAGGVLFAQYDMGTAPVEVGFNGTDQLTINPGADLAASTGYYITIDGTVALDLAGNQFAGYNTTTDWDFVTFGPPNITSIAPETGTAICIGENLIINGSFLTGVTHVTFEGGLVATGSDVVVISDTEVRAIAPLNALTGPIIAMKDISTGNPQAEVKTDTLAIVPNTVLLGPSSASLTFGSINNTTVCSSGSTTESTLAIAISGGTSNYTINYTRENQALTINDGLIENGYTLGDDISINPVHLDQDNIYTLTGVTDNEGCSVSLAQISGSYTIRENSRAVVEAGGDALGEFSYYLPNGFVFTLDAGPLANPPSFSGAGGILWTNPGSSNGSFDNDTNLNADYTIGVNDIFNNSVVLTLTTTGNPTACDPISDNLIVNFVADATATPEIAGGGSTFCWDGNAVNPVIVILDGQVGGDATGGLWERIPDGADPDGGSYAGFDGGTVSSIILNGTYTLSNYEQNTLGYASLQLTPTGGVGTPSAEPMTLSLSLIPTIAFNNPALSVCEGDNSVLYSVSDNAGSSYNWTVPTTDGTTFVGQGTSTIIVDWGSGTNITASAQTINVTEINTDGCSGMQGVNVTVNPLPPVSFLPPQTNFTTADAPFLLELVSINGSDTTQLIESADTTIFFSGQAVYKDSNDDWIFNPSLLTYDSIAPSNNIYTISFSFTNANGCTSSGTEIFTLYDANSLITGLARAYCVYDSASVILDPFLINDEFDYTWRLQEDGTLFTQSQSTSSGLINVAGIDYIFRPDSAGQYLNTSQERELLVRYFTYDPILTTYNSRSQLTTVFARPTLDFILAENRVCTTANDISLEPGNTVSAATGTFFEFTTNRPESGVITYFFDTNNPLDKTKWKDFELNIDKLIVQDSINGDTLDITYRYAEGNEFGIVCENTIIKNMVIYAQPFTPQTTELNNTYCVTNLTNIPTATITNQLTGFDRDGDPVEARVIWRDVFGSEVSNDPLFTPNAAQLASESNTFKVSQVLFNGCESEETEVIFINFTGVAYNLINNCYDDSGTLRISFPLGNNNQISELNWEIQDLQGNTIQTFPNVLPTQIIELSVGVGFEPGGYNLVLDLQTTTGCIVSFTQVIGVLESITVTETNVYNQDFEADGGGWVSESVSGISAWEYGLPNGNVINTAEEGQNVWMTGLNPGYSAGTKTNLYSACFDISQLERPMIKIGTFYNTTGDDGAVIQYTNDTNLATATWEILGELGTGDKWYNTQDIFANPGDQDTKLFGWSADTDTTWQESKHVLDEVNPAMGNVILRVQFVSGDANRPNKDGLAIDNLFIGNRTRTVLLENFSSTMQATNTADENASIDTLANTTTALAVIEYHPDMDGDDPLSSSPDADARALYYGITTTPRVAIDGKAEADLRYTEWGKDEYSIRALNSSPLTIITTVAQNGDAIDISSDITALENLPGNYIVHTAIVANQLLASNYPADQILSGENRFNYVVQKMLPSASGRKFDTPLTQGDNFTVTNSWSTSEEYAPGTYSIIIFVQDEQSKLVYQTEIIEPNLSTITGIEEQLDLYGFASYPNPANEELTFKFKNAVIKDTKIKVYDQLGQLTYTTTLVKGNSQIELATVSWTPGIYYIQTELNGEPIQKRIIVQH